FVSESRQLAGVRNSSVKHRWKARCDLFAKGSKAFDESKKHELSAAANRWIFVTPARMFLPLLSLSRILPAVMLSSGISNLLSYNTRWTRAAGARKTYPPATAGGSDSCLVRRRLL